MWPRKQLDIAWSELAFGYWHVLKPKPAPTTGSIVGTNWIRPDEAIVSLSVRTAWDLFLQAQQFAAGSEIIVSGVTIPDMVRIIEHHQLVPVPVAVDADRLEPSLAEIERAITPRTRAILVAHLFGALVDMEPIIRLARRHGLIVIEDCAQAFVGSGYAGHGETDLSLFSFGPIKTATALGGAVVRVRDADVRDRMARLQGAYPIQSQRAYFSRLTKYTAIRVMCWPWVYGFVARAYRLFGGDFDRKVASAAHSFPGAQFFAQIRRQPCSALLHMLQHRIATFEKRAAPALRRRIARGHQLAAALPAGMVVGGRNETHTFWVMPLRVANAAEVLAALLQARFDATSRSSLMVVRSPGHSMDDLPQIAPWLAETIFLPNGHDIPDSEWKRVSRILSDVAQIVPAVPPKETIEPAAALSVSVTS